MERTIYAKLDNGLDGFMKLINTLRRKEFNISNIKMNDDGTSHFVYITITSSMDDVGLSAVNYMQKLYGVNDIKLL